MAQRLRALTSLTGEKKFNSQSPHGDSQPSTALVIEDSTSGLCGHFTYTVERYKAKHPDT